MPDEGLTHDNGVGYTAIDELEVWTLVQCVSYLLFAERCTSMIGRLRYS